MNIRHSSAQLVSASSAPLVAAAPDWMEAPGEEAASGSSGNQTYILLGSQRPKEEGALWAC